MEWRFTIYDRTNTATVIEEPPGWADMEIKLRRDKNLHGIFFDFQTNQFEFIGIAFDIITAEYDEYGIEGKGSLLIEYLCGRLWKSFYTGNLLYAKYNGTCGTDCSLVMSVEGSSAQLALVNRMEQKVDLSATKAFDKITDLAPYDKLPFDIMLPSKTVRVKAEAKNEEDHIANLQAGWDINWEFGPVNTGTLQGSVAPIFDNVQTNDLEGLNVQTIFDFVNAENIVNRQEPDPIYINTITEAIECSSGSVNIDFRCKGNMTNISLGGGDITCILQFRKSTGSFYNGSVATTVAAWNCLLPSTPGSSLGLGLSNPFNVDFDFSYNGVIALDPNEKLYLVFFISVFKPTNYAEHIRLTVFKESFIKLYVDSICEPTNSHAYMINEVTSRVMESITNNHLKLYSEWLGRTDSQPYSFPANGCGALKCLLNGLLVRSAKLTDGTEPKIFISLKDILDALSAIDNIGVGMESTDKVRIENWKYFYKDNIMLVCDAVEKINTTVKEADHIAIFKFGYEKWEAENFNGLDEFLTKREYRTQLTQVSNVLEKLCKWIFSGYAYEVTRRQGPNSKDWRYDNDIFGLCLNADYTVEQGNLTNAVNLVDPPTIINFRVSPLRNALKWFDRIIASYKKTLAANKLIFSYADGNYIAEGNLNDDACRLEAGIIKENQDLDITVFEDAQDGIPIFDLETKQYQYPLEVEDFVTMMANPYGLIQYDCGGPPGAGWIDELTYRPNDGLATFTLTPKRGWTA